MKPKVLIVEDEGLIAQHISQLLRSNDYHICAISSDAKTALKTIEEHSPDLILLDIRIKGEISGIDLGQKVKILYKIPIIYLTAFSDLETMKQAELTEPAGYIIKPFRSQQLLAALAIAITNY